MRLWSLHPSLLDRQALVAVWREGLLAKKVLEGKTKGYRNHPQLDRFKAAPDPLAAINFYLHEIADEAEKRGYNFDRSKLAERKVYAKISVADGQIAYEWEHLLIKCKARSIKHYEEIARRLPAHHSLFTVREGRVASWERISK